MPLGDISGGKGFADGGRKAKESESIGDGGARLAHALGDFFLSEPKFINEDLISLRGFQRRDVFSLEVFHQSDLEGFYGVCCADDGGNPLKPCQFSGAPAPFSRNEFVLILPHKAHDNGLNNSYFLQGLCERAQSVLIHPLSGLARIRLDGIYGNLPEGCLLLFT
jgi:hypothetical protein